MVNDTSIMCGKPLPEGYGNYVSIDIVEYMLKRRMLNADAEEMMSMIRPYAVTANKAVSCMVIPREDMSAIRDPEHFGKYMKNHLAAEIAELIVNHKKFKVEKIVNPSDLSTEWRSNVKVIFDVDGTMNQDEVE